MLEGLSCSESLLLHKKGGKRVLCGCRVRSNNLRIWRMNQLFWIINKVINRQTEMCVETFNFSITIIILIGVQSTQRAKFSIISNPCYAYRNHLHNSFLLSSSLCGPQLSLLKIKGKVTKMEWGGQRGEFSCCTTLCQELSDINHQQKNHQLQAPSGIEVHCTPTRNQLP